MVLVGEDAIRLFHDQNCLSDIVLSMVGINVTKDKPYTTMDCDDTHMDTSWWRHCIIASMRKR